MTPTYRSGLQMHRRHLACLLPAILLSLSIAACGRTPERGGQSTVAVRDSAGVRIVELSDAYRFQLPQWTVGPEPYLSIGEADGPGELELFRVAGATLMRDGGVAVGNAGSGEVRVFDRTGEHVGTFGGRGSGPGEFRRMSWIGRTGDDTLATFDESQRRITLFTIAGELIHAVGLDAPEGGITFEPVGIQNGRLLVRSELHRRGGNGEYRDSAQFLLYDMTGALVHQMASIAGVERYFYTAASGMSAGFEPIFGREAHAAAFGERVVLASTDGFELDVYDGAGLSMKVVSNIDLAPATEEEVDSWRQSLRERTSDLTGEFATVVHTTINRLPVRGTPPAFQRLVIDAERFVWVLEPHRVPNGSRRWVVLGSDGIPVARVEMPPRLELFEIGEGYVLGLRRDDHGVERVEAYGLDRGS